MNSSIGEKEVNEALDSIREIKKTLQNNIGILRPFLYERRFIRLCLVSAAVYAVFFGLLYAAVHFWGSFSQIPAVGKAGFALYGVAAIFGAARYKWRILSQCAQENFQEFSLHKLFLLPELSKLSVSFLLLFAGMAFLGVIVALQVGSWNIMLPLAFLFYTFIALHYGLSLYLRAYRILAAVSGILMICTALFMNQNPLLWAGCTLTLYFLLFALVADFEGKHS